jgi:hypothetical protein
LTLIFLFRSGLNKKVVKNTKESAIVELLTTRSAEQIVAAKNAYEKSLLCFFLDFKGLK